MNGFNQVIKPSTECATAVPNSGPSPAPVPNVVTPTQASLFELPPPNMNLLYAATWSAAAAASRDSLSLTLTTNIKLSVYALTKTGYDQLNSCYPATLPPGINAIASAGSSYFGMKSNDNMNLCFNFLTATNANVVATFNFNASSSSQV